jgi:hypothetical protein
MSSIDECPHCGEQAHCMEYDSDEDLYLMRCDNECGDFWVTDDTETWK